MTDYSWDTPGLPDRDERDRCKWHSGLCSYRDDDPTRCPLCHLTLAVRRCDCIRADALPLTVERMDQIIAAGPDTSTAVFAQEHRLDYDRAKKVRNYITGRR